MLRLTLEFEIETTESSEDVLEGVAVVTEKNRADMA
jgi:hypothetical protein